MLSDSGIFTLLKSLLRFLRKGSLPARAQGAVAVANTGAVGIQRRRRISIKSGDTIPPAMTDLSLSVVFFLLVNVSVMSFTKAQQAVAVNVPEIAKPVGAVNPGQGLREKRIILLKDGKLVSEGKPLELAAVGLFAAGASGVIVEADKEAAVGKLLELQQVLLKAGCDMQILVKDKKS